MATVPCRALPRDLPPPGHEDDDSVTVRSGPAPLVPVRCYSCGLQIAARHAKFMTLLQEGAVEPGAALDAVGATRVCCRRMLLSQPVFSDQLPVVVRVDHKEDASVEVSFKDVGAIDGGSGELEPGIGEPEKNEMP